MFGRKCRTKLIVLKKVLKPRHELNEMEEQREIKLMNKIYYDREAKKTQKIENQDEILIIKPGETTSLKKSLKK